MKSVVATYAKRLLLITLAAGVLALVLFFVLPGTWFSPSVPFLFAFYYACSLLSFIMLSRSLQTKFSRFVSVFMLTTAVKLFLYISIMIIYAFINKKDAVPFLLNFFILYIVYTIFEVTQIIGLTKLSTSAGKMKHES
ncbi:MAG: hypothetical protein NTX43_12115 [Bacteroidetes bacterium]|nr:hypothetical protein [Bacteroidota bacterium]